MPIILGKFVNVREVDIIDRLTDEDMCIDAIDDAIKEIQLLRGRVAELEAAQHRVERTLPNESRQPSWCDDGLDDAVIGSLP